MTILVLQGSANFTLFVISAIFCGKFNFCDFRELGSLAFWIYVAGIIISDTKPVSQEANKRRSNEDGEGENCVDQGDVNVADANVLDDGDGEKYYRKIEHLITCPGNYFKSRWWEKMKKKSIMTMTGGTFMWMVR